MCLTCATSVSNHHKDVKDIITGDSRLSDREAIITEDVHSIVTLAITCACLIESERKTGGGGGT